MEINNPIAAVPLCILFCICLGLSANVGCDSGSKVGEKENATETPARQAEAHSAGHAHEAGDELVWPVVEKSPDKSMELSYGHHGKHFHAGEKIEPAVAILKDKTSVDDAVVSVGLVGSDGAVANFVKTVYEPETNEEPAHYAQGELTIPTEGSQMTIRYRVVLKDGNDFERDVAIDFGSHE